jgi:hypothetical protein
MHPGNESQYLSNLLSKKPVISPVIILQAINNSEISKLKLPEFTISKYCNQLAANSTSILGGKTFHVYTIECPFSKLFAAFAKNLSGTNASLGANATAPPKNLNTKGLGQLKVYEYKTADRTYRLMLRVNSPLFSSAASQGVQEKPDIGKYIPVIDATAKTLKIR